MIGKPAARYKQRAVRGDMNMLGLLDPGLLLAVGDGAVTWPGSGACHQPRRRMKRMPETVRRTIEVERHDP
ncbi:hypothetical protein [Ralstonia pseudosolanacearum]